MLALPIAYGQAGLANQSYKLTISFITSYIALCLLVCYGLLNLTKQICLYYEYLLVSY